MKGLFGRAVFLWALPLFVVIGTIGLSSDSHSEGLGVNWHVFDEGGGRGVSSNHVVLASIGQSASGEAEGPSGRLHAGFIQSVEVPGAPVLSWAGTEGYESDGVSPDTGKSGTEFVYLIVYTSQGNVPPDERSPMLHVTFQDQEIPDSPFQMIDVDPGDTEYTDGKLYTLTLTLNEPGLYTYHFEAWDADGLLATGKPTEETPGPEVFPPPGSIQGVVTSVSSLITGEVSGPIGGALVRAWKEGIELGKATTGDTGEYKIPNLPPGTYTVTAERSGYLQGIQEGIEVISEEVTICNFELEPFPGKPWTIMVYLDGDNDLEDAGIDDLNEMEMVGSTDHVNLLVQFDRIPGYDTSNGDWTGCRRYYVTKDADLKKITSRLIEDLGEVNMGDPRTVVDFVRWAVERYPAERYALIFWNHGGGWRKRASRDEALKAVCWDETSQGDCLYMKEVQNALFSLRDLLPGGISLVGFDACLMGMIEVAWEIRDCAKVMVGSEEVEPWDGWPYGRILQGLAQDPSIGEEELSRLIVEQYGAFYGSGSEFTQSAISLKHVPSLLHSLTALSDVLIPVARTTTIQDARDGVQSYFEPDFCDLYDFADRLTQNTDIDTEVREAAEALKAAISEAVLYEWSGDNSPGSHGLSIYFPTERVSPDYKEGVIDLPRDSTWDEFLVAFTTPTIPPSPPTLYPIADVEIGEPIKVSWSASSDPQGGTVTYELQEATWLELKLSDSGEEGDTVWDMVGFRQVESPVNTPPLAYYSGRGDNLESSLTLRDELDLTGGGYTLTFFCKYSIEEGYDYAYVEYGYPVDTGYEWVELDRFTGQQDSWIMKSYGPLGTEVRKIRFRYVTDDYITDEGFWVDDIRVSGDDFRTIVEGISDTSYEVPGKPAQGIYYYKVRAKSSGGEVSAWSNVEDVLIGEPNTPPTLTLIEPSEDVVISGDPPKDLELSWDDSDPDNDAKIALYYTSWTHDQTDLQEADLVLIQDGISEDDKEDSFTWTITSRIPNGKYRIVGIIQDGVNPPVQSMAPGTVTVDFEKPEVEWTIMVYLDGDNNLEDAGIDDMNEMEVVGSTPEVNIVVQFDRIPGYDTSNGDWTGTRRYYVTQDSDPQRIGSSLVQDLGEVNMGDPRTLTDFISWARANYPAKKTALVLWNHGGGWRARDEVRRAVCWDDTSLDEHGRPDCLYMKEVGEALSAATSGGVDKLTIVGFDACLMGMIEVAYEIQSYATFMIGSEEVEPWDGWPYDLILKVLSENPQMGWDEFAKAIVSEYGAYYQDAPQTTQSAIDLREIDALNTALDTLAKSLTPIAGEEYVRAARRGTTSYWVPAFADLYDFCENLSQSTSDTDVQQQAISVMDAIKASVVAEWHSPDLEGSHGLSIYFPRVCMNPDYNQDVIAFPGASQWDEFLHEFAGPGGKIKGHVTFGGEGVPRVDVICFRIEGLHDEGLGHLLRMRREELLAHCREEEAWAVTDEVGYYEIAGLPEGEYLVFAWPWLPFMEPAEGEEPKNLTQEWSQASVSIDSESSVDFSLQEAGGFEGAVIDPGTGQGIADTWLEAWPEWFDWDLNTLIERLSEFSFGVGSTGWLDADGDGVIDPGSYVIPNLKLDTFEVLVLPPEPYVEESLLAKTSPPKLTPLDILLNVGCGIRGRVTSRDETGVQVGVPGVDVLCFRIDELGGEGLKGLLRMKRINLLAHCKKEEAWAVTDETGYYEIAGLPEGEYLVFAWPWLPFMEPAEGEDPKNLTQEWQMTQLATSGVSTVDFYLHDAGGFQGQVTGLEGAGIPDTWLEAWPEWFDWDLNTLIERLDEFSFGVGSTGWLDADGDGVIDPGEYAIPNLKKGVFSVFVYPPVDSEYVEERVEAPTSPPDMTLLDIPLNVGGVIEGVVTYNDRGVPKVDVFCLEIGWAEEHLSRIIRMNPRDLKAYIAKRQDGGGWAVTEEDDPDTPDVDESGQYRIVGLPEGDYLVCAWPWIVYMESTIWSGGTEDVSPENLTQEWQEAYVSFQGAARVDFVLQDAGGFGGLVMGEDGTQMQDTEVLAYPAWLEPEAFYGWDISLILERLHEFSFGFDTSGWLDETQPGYYAVPCLKFGEFHLDAWPPPDEFQPQRLEVATTLENISVDELTTQDILLRSGGVFSGQVTYNDEGIEGVDVFALRLEGLDEDWKRLLRMSRDDLRKCVRQDEIEGGWDVTDKDGNYRITGLPDGEYLVFSWPLDVFFESFLNQDPSVGVRNLTQEWKGPFTIPGEPDGRDVVVDFQLQDAGGFEGVVGDVYGQEIPEVVLVAYPIWLYPEDAYVQNLDAIVSRLDQFSFGIFETGCIPDLSKGSYVIPCLKPYTDPSGTSTDHGVFHLDAWPPDGSPYLPVFKEEAVTSEVLTRVDFILPQGGTISGRVTFDLDGDGEPDGIGDVWVICFKEDGEKPDESNNNYQALGRVFDLLKSGPDKMMSLLRAQQTEERDEWEEFGFAETDYDGYYRITGLKEGEYIAFAFPLIPFIESLETENPLNLTQEWRKATINVGVETKLDFALSDGAGFDGLVTDLAGVEVEDTFVAAYPTWFNLYEMEPMVETYGIEDFSIGFFETGYTGEFSPGRYVIPCLKPGQFNVDAWPDPESGFSPAFTQATAGEEPFTDLGLTSHDITLEEGAKITGIVTYNESPVEGVWVIAIPAADIWTHAQETIKAVIHEVGLRASTDEKETDEEISDEMDVPFPIAGTDEGGTYEIAGLPPGEYYVFAWPLEVYLNSPFIEGDTPLNLTQEWQKVNVVSGENTLDFTLSDAGGITGLVTDPDGIEVPGVFVAAYPDWFPQDAFHEGDVSAIPDERLHEFSIGMMHTGEFGSPGQYVIPCLKAGGYIVDALPLHETGLLPSFGNQANVTQEDISAGTLTQLDIGLLRGGTIQGEVTFEGKGVAGVEVLAFEVHGREEEVKGAIRKGIHGLRGLATRQGGGGFSVTDQDGKFTITDLDEGTYLVVAWPIGRFYPEEGQDPQNLTQKWLMVEIDFTNPIASLLIELELAGGFKGVVSDADGTKVQGFGVVAYPTWFDIYSQDLSELESPERFSIGFTETDHAGYYEIPCLRQGDTFRVDVWPPLDDDTQYIPTFTEASTVAQAPDLTTHDIVLSEMGTISGTVKGPDGVGVPGCEVIAVVEEVFTQEAERAKRVVPRHIRSLFSQRQDEGLWGGWAITDENGDYRITGLQDGIYVVFCFPPQEKETSLAYAWETGVEVTGGDETRCDFELVPPAFVYGLVRDGYGGPISGAEILAWQEGEEAFGWGYAVSDEDGYYEIYLPEGVYSGGCFHPDYCPSFVWDKEILSGCSYEKNWTLYIGGSLSGVITGIITEDEETESTQAEGEEDILWDYVVAAFPDDLRFEPWNLRWLVEQGPIHESPVWQEMDSSGAIHHRYEFRHIPSGTYKLYLLKFSETMEEKVSEPETSGRLRAAIKGSVRLKRPVPEEDEAHPGMWFSVTTREVVHEVQVLEGEPTTQDIQCEVDTGGIEGVIAIEDDHPLSEEWWEPAVVSLTTNGDLYGLSIVFSENPQGRYAIPDVSAGTYTIGGDVVGYPLYTGTATISTGQTTEHDIKIASGVRISGWVTDAKTDPPAPIPDAKITISREGFEEDTYTDESGRYELRVAPNQVYVVECTKEGYKPQEKVVEVGLEDIRCDFSLGSDFTVSGTVSSNGEAVSGAEISLLAGYNVLKSVVTDVNGRYEIKNVPPSHYGLLCYAEGYGTQLVEIDVIDRDVTQDFVLSRGFSVSGVITYIPPAKAGGEPYEGAELYALRSDSFEVASFAQSDSTGAYTLKGLVEGPYYIVAVVCGYPPMVWDAEPGEAVFPINPEDIQPLQVSGDVTDINFDFARDEVGPEFEFYLAWHPAYPDERLCIYITSSEPIKDDSLTGTWSGKDAEGGVVDVSAIPCAPVYIGGGGFGDEWLVQLEVSGIPEEVEELTLTVTGSDESGVEGTGSIALRREDMSPTELAEKRSKPAEVYTETRVEMKTDESEVVAPPNALKGTGEIVFTKRVAFKSGGSASTLSVRTMPDYFASHPYRLEVAGTELREDAHLVITLAYDKDEVTDTSLIDIYKRSGDEWVKITEGRVVDPDLGTISCKVGKADLSSTQARANGGEEGEFIVGGLSVTAGAISGTVISDDTPIEGATVKAIQGNTVVKSTTTDVNGQYTISDLDPGTYTVRAEKTGYVTKEKTVGVVAGQTIQCNFELELEEVVLKFDAYNYPNPFDPTKESTTIKYVLNEDVEDLSIRIYDIAGSLVYEYRDLDKTKGPHDTTFYGTVDNVEGGTPLASGIYIVVVKADDEIKAFKMAIRK